MSKKTEAEYPEPRIVKLNDDLTQYECTWPGCEFDALERAAYDRHVDPERSPHRDKTAPLAAPLTEDERGELVALREEVTALRNENRALKGKATRLENRMHADAVEDEAATAEKES